MGFTSWLIARFGGDSTEFDKCVAKCEAEARHFGKSVSSEMRNMIGGYLTLGYAVGLVGDAFSRAGRVKDLSDRLGISTDRIQEMQFAADQTGTSIEAMVKAIQILNKSRGIALQDPNNKESQVFASKGISRAMLETMSGEDIFYKLSHHAKEAQNPQQELNDMILLMGRTAPEVFTAMREGMESFADAAHKAGMVLNKDVIGKLDDTQDKFNVVKQSVGNILAGWAVKAYDAVTYAGTYYGAMVGSGTSGENFDKVFNKTLADIEKEDAAKEQAKSSAKQRFDATAKAEKDKADKATTYTPEQWAFKPHSGGLADIGGFGKSAASAMVSSLELVKDATERTAKATETIATNTATDMEQDE